MKDNISAAIEPMKQFETELQRTDMTKRRRDGLDEADGQLLANRLQITDDELAFGFSILTLFLAFSAHQAHNGERVSEAKEANKSDPLSRSYSQRLLARAGCSTPRL